MIRKRGLIILGLVMGLFFGTGVSSDLAVSAANLQLNNNTQVPVGSIFMFGEHRFIKLGINKDISNNNVTYAMMAFPFEQGPMDESTSSWNSTITPNQSNEERSGSNNWIRSSSDTNIFGSDIKSRLNTLSYGYRSQYLPSISLRERNLITTVNWDMYAENDTTCKLMDINGNVPTNCLWQGQVALLSYKEWLNGTSYTNNQPVKNIYCQSIYGGSCPVDSAVAAMPIWLRTPISGNNVSFYRITPLGGTVSNFAASHQYMAIMPSLNLVQNTITCSGSGSFDDPYYLAGNAGDCANAENPYFANNQIESLPVGSVVEFSSEKWVKFDDQHEPLQGGRYFVLSRAATNNQPYNDSNSVLFKTSKLNSYLNNVVSPQLNQNWIESRLWDVGSTMGRSESILDSKIIVPSNIDWMRRGWVWCGSVFNRSLRICQQGDFDGTNTNNPLRPWLRTWLSWKIYDERGGQQMHHVGNYGEDNNAQLNTVPAGVLPAIVFKDSLRIQQETDMNGRGTLNKPYHLCDNVTVACDATENVKPELSASVSWDSGAGSLSLAGNTKLMMTGQQIEVWADVCNKNGQCVRKASTLTSNGNNQLFSLTWSRNELSAGDYSGTVWVGAKSSNQVEDQYQSTETNQVAFNIVARNMVLSVVKNRVFNITLGDASIFNLTPGTNQGITVSIDGNNIVSVAGMVAADIQVPFGSTVLAFKALDVPQSVIVDSGLTP